MAETTKGWARRLADDVVDHGGGDRALIEFLLIQTRSGALREANAECRLMADRARIVAEEHHVDECEIGQTIPRAAMAYANKCGDAILALIYKEPTL